MQVWLLFWRSHDLCGKTCNFRAGYLSFNDGCIAFTTALDASKIHKYLCCELNSRNITSVYLSKPYPHPFVTSLFHVPI